MLQEHNNKIRHVFDIRYAYITATVEECLCLVYVDHSWSFFMPSGSDEDYSNNYENWNSFYFSPNPSGVALFSDCSDPLDLLLKP